MSQEELKRIVKNFQTKVILEGKLPTITRQDRFVLLGSCFAENIGALLQDLHFNTRVNPSGVLYNPVSLADHIMNALLGQKLHEDQWIFYDGLWHSLMHHGSFSATDREQLAERVSSSISLLQDSLTTADVLLVTFGTAHIYTHTSTGQAAANCHKMPSSEFEKRLVPSDEIVALWLKVISMLHKVNADLTIVFTVSPVRYIRDGLVSSNRSKANLLTAIHELVAINDACFYFPAYEIVIDELRDYRFYAEDMVHPSSQAVDYVLSSFVSNTFDHATQEYFREMGALQRDLRHRPLHPSTSAHKQFLSRVLEKISRLEERYPDLDLGVETEQIRNQIKS